MELRKGEKMPRSKSKTAERIPQALQPRYEEIVEITDRVCREHLNEEYSEMARRLAARLARKRPSPLLKGQANIWACGIVHALGTVNFLFDESFEPHMTVNELCQAFGVKKTSGTNKARQIRDMFGMFQLDPEWTLPSMIEENPLVWLLKVDGMIVDIRDMPREMQEIAFEKGLIPYIPADRK